MMATVPDDRDRNRQESERDELAEWSKRAKRVLRQKLRALRQALPEKAAEARSARIVDHLLQEPRVSAAQAVALFWPMLERREIDLRPLDLQLRARGVDLYYPFMTRSDRGDITTGFRLVADVAELTVQGQRFAEPSPTARLAEPGDLDVVVVPALAATPLGHRLGYGSGFYDATLPQFCPPALSIVVVHDFQLMLELPREPHDRVCDEVVTDGQERRGGLAAPGR
jgi:5-formyltetrahydrofolate cyclo-ligase